MKASALVGMGFVLSALPAVAQNLGGNQQYCQTVNGHLVCKSGDRYDRGSLLRGLGEWQPSARTGIAVPISLCGPDRFPQSFGAYNNLYGFGR